MATAVARAVSVEDIDAPWAVVSDAVDDGDADEYKTSKRVKVFET